MTVILQVLREAREFAVANPVSSSSSDESMCQKAAASRISFLALWENSAGPAHLEALALIARQCSASTADIVDTLPQQDRRALEDRNMRLMVRSSDTFFSIKHFSIQHGISFIGQPFLDFFVGGPSVDISLFLTEIFNEDFYRLPARTTTSITLYRSLTTNQITV